MRTVVFLLFLLALNPPPGARAAIGDPPGEDRVTTVPKTSLPVPQLPGLMPVPTARAVKWDYFEYPVRSTSPGSKEGRRCFHRPAALHDARPAEAGADRCHTRERNQRRGNSIKRELIDVTHRQYPDIKNYAILTRKAARVAGGNGKARFLEDLFEKVETESFANIGVQVIWTDTYDEVPQRILEICNIDE